MTHHGFNSTAVETFMAAYFKGKTDVGWARAYSADDTNAPAPASSPPLNSSIDSASTLTTNNGKGYWSGVRQLNFAARAVYAGSTIGGGVEAGGRPDHEDLSNLLKTTDMLSPRLFDSCNTGYQLKYLVLWQPTLNILLTFWDVNITSYLARGSHSRTASFQFTTDSNNALSSAEEQISLSPLEATTTWEDEVAFIYDAVEFNVNGIIQSWNTEQSAPINSDSSPFSGKGTIPST
ncbi:MAG: hypothetical protein RIC55_18625 [Pirellulaceae bacterium]